MHKRWQLLAVAVAVAVMGFDLSSNAGQGNGIRLDGWRFSPLNGWTVSPFASVSAMYDSNVLTEENNEDSDTFLEGMLGLDIRRAGDMLAIESQLAVIRRAYMDFNDLDYASFGEAIRVRYGRPGRTYLLADQRYRRIEDRDISGYTVNSSDASSETASLGFLTANSRRDMHNAGVKVGTDFSDKITANATYAFAMVNYDNDDLLDSAEHVMVLEGGYKITEKTVAIMDIQYGVEDSEAFADIAQFAAVRAGATSRGTDKVQYRVGLGWQTYMRPDGAGDDVNGVSANLMAIWRATEKISVEAGGRNDVLASSLYRENVRTVSSAWVGATYRPIATVQAQVSGSYGQEKHSDPVDIGGAMKTRKDGVLDLNVRAVYTPPANFMSVFLQVGYVSVDSNVAGYDDLRAGGGVTLRY